MCCPASSRDTGGTFNSNRRDTTTMKASTLVLGFVQRAMRHDWDFESAHRAAFDERAAPEIIRLLGRAMDTGSVSGSPDWQAGMRGIVELVASRSFVGQIERSVGFRPAQPYVKAMRELTAPDAQWISEATPIPAAEATFDFVAVEPRKLATIVPFTMEVLNAGTEIFASEVQAAMVRSVANVESLTFIDPSIAPDAESPGSVLYGINETPPAGNAAGDLEALVDAMLTAGGDVQTAVLCCSPRAALKLASVYPAEQIGVNGGSVAGIPIAVSHACDEAGSSDGSMLALIDAKGIMLHDDGLDLYRADHADIRAYDSNDTAYSLFQIGMSAIRVIRAVAWKRAREGSVAWCRASWAR